MFKVTYLAGGQDVTSAVTGGTYSARLASGASIVLVIKVTRTKAARIGDLRTFAVRATSSSEPTAQDNVAAVVRVAQ
jgi:ribosomal protein L14